MAMLNRKMLIYPFDKAHGRYDMFHIAN